LWLVVFGVGLADGGGSDVGLADGGGSDVGFRPRE